MQLTVLGIQNTTKKFLLLCVTTCWPVLVSRWKSNMKVFSIIN